MPISKGKSMKKVPPLLFPQTQKTLCKTQSTRSIIFATPPSPATFNCVVGADFHRVGAGGSSSRCFRGLLGCMARIGACRSAISLATEGPSVVCVTPQPLESIELSMCLPFSLQACFGQKLAASFQLQMWLVPPLNIVGS
ncbi:caspase recruitment domain-containing protein 11 [Striga asiatica]|uniref:Caspase recruitment domain-containing protein 11 n=1 Tax=Striga asiatica TaxID=4170 RepID=A0A5A7P3W9_STRAF|nr:caspase recruitment domain-containing protein 11 [Striga asiatica]